MQAPDANFDDITFVAFDTETTGREPTRARLVELAAVRCRGLEGAGEAETFQELIRPDTPIPRESSRAHGIHDADVPKPGKGKMKPATDRMSRARRKELAAAAMQAAASEAQ